MNDANFLSFPVVHELNFLKKRKKWFVKAWMWKKSGCWCQFPFHHNWVRAAAFFLATQANLACVSKSLTRRKEGGLAKEGTGMIVVVCCCSPLHLLGLVGCRSNKIRNCGFYFSCSFRIRTENVCIEWAMVGWLVLVFFCFAIVRPSIHPFIPFRAFTSRKGACPILLEITQQPHTISILLYLCIWSHLTFFFVPPSSIIL